MPKKGDNSSPSFEEDLHRLEEIVEKLESGIAIEEAIQLYEEGIKLSGKLESRLTEIERKVYEVKNMPKLAKEEDKKLDLSLFE